MNAISEIHNINHLTEQFILRFGIESHRDLKRLGEYQSLEDENLKRKIYDRTRYKFQKEGIKLVTDISPIEARFERVQTKQLKLQDKRIRTLKLCLLGFIFAFLATESFKFYEQFEVLTIFKYTIPAMIEISIFLLSLKNGIVSKILLTGLVIFNTATFTYKTIETDKNLKQAQVNAISKTIFLNEQKSKIEMQIKAEESDLKSTKDKFEDLVSKNYFKAANTTYSASINSKTENLKNLRERSVKNDMEILKAGESRSGQSLIGIDTVFMISLKVILQMIFLFLVLDLKKSTFKSELQ